MNESGKYQVLQEPGHAGSHPKCYADALQGYLAAFGRSAPAAPPAPATATATLPGTIVVGVDDSPAGCTALDHAAIEAHLHGWELRLVHAQHSGVRQATRAAGSQLLDRLVDRVHVAAPEVAVTRHLAIGSAVSSLLVEGRNADLLVVGHRHKAVGTMLGLTVGDQVAAQHSGIVMVVRMPYWPPESGFGALPLVVGVDNPALMTSAVAFALEEARLRGCELVVLHAQPNATTCERTEIVGGVVVHRRTVDADPSPALIDYSRRAAAVVVGRRGVGINPVTMLGSVSRAMVQHADCPVFLIG
ncbi:nucleotide-binding universal stress UspA family protein [Actinoplanes campanulatus]|uniref:Nucleotide-binding universal stress UspA family protein n=1 Tax=Actinoplanes campanulatus TaxID=113559 RepID=A0A7W5FKA4_9ACTN|nr:universal stress protein [Actinoplanes campanulatus]MBB3101472.1 nucleotide-binding universal stress UspA family protein [Actinoplanes campanulatus]GGN50682.1 universal stress protein [Actinoplanes campanulatus]GID42067.1 universal stress protein [Actinoplanes campanulatus]